MESVPDNESEALGAGMAFSLQATGADLQEIKRKFTSQTLETARKEKNGES